MMDFLISNRPAEPHRAVDLDEGRGLQNRDNYGREELGMNSSEISSDMNALQELANSNPPIFTEPTINSVNNAIQNVRAYLRSPNQTNWDLAMYDVLGARIAVYTF